MPGRSKVTANDEERSALRALARSAHRSEADRARALLLTLAGRRAAGIAASLGVHVSTVREWRGLFTHGGIAALRHRKPPGRPNRIGAAAAAMAEAILAGDVDHGHRWTLPRLRAEIRRRGGPAIGSAWLSVQLRQRGSLGAIDSAAVDRPTLKGRQDAEAIAAGRRRLEELRRQAAAGVIDLLFLDESEARTHPYLAHCWAKRGAELRIQAPGQARRRAMLGAFDPIRPWLLVRTSATKRSTDFVGLLDDLSLVYGEEERVKPLVIVMDNGPIHTSKLTTKALAARPWLTLEWLPKYAPELNAIEHRWRDLKQHHLANRTFADADDLEQAIHCGVERLNHERQPHPSPPFLKAA